MRAEDIKGMTPEQIKNYLCLDAVPDSFQHVTIPKGEELFIGRIAKQPKQGHFEDGGLQFQIKLPDGVKITDKAEDWFSKWEPLGEKF